MAPLWRNNNHHNIVGSSKPFLLLRLLALLVVVVSTTTTEDEDDTTTLEYRDDFFMPYDAGYIFFIAIIIVTGFIFSIATSWLTTTTTTTTFQQHQSEEEEGEIHWSATFVCGLLATASAAMAAWGVTARSKEVKSGGSWTGIGMGSFLLLLFGLIPLVGLISTIKKSARSMVVACSVSSVYVLGFFLLLIPGLVGFAVYCKRMDEVQQYEYFGPMNITGYGTRWKDMDSCLIDHEGVCSGYYGFVEVEWGVDIECSCSGDITNDNDNNMWCNVNVTVHECTLDLCEMRCGHPEDIWCEETCPMALSQEQLDTGKAKVENCVVEMFNLSDIETIEISEEYILLIPPPEDDDDSDNWSITLNLYGDCESCSASVYVPLESALDIKRIAKPLTYAGISSTVVFFGILLYLRCCHQQTKRRQLYPIMASSSNSQHGYRWQQQQQQQDHEHKYGEESFQQQNVVWCWKEDPGCIIRHEDFEFVGDPKEGWIMYDNNAQDVLERAYQIQGGVGFCYPLMGYRVDFSTMKQIKLKTGYERQVQRLV